MTRVHRVPFTLLGLLGLVLVVAGGTTTFKPVAPNADSSCTVQDDYSPEPTDCRTFYRCVHGKMVSKSCPYLTVFSPALNVCVHAGSEHDKCTPQRPVQECARGNVEFIPDPTRCHLYWNCSQSTARLSQCPYPQGFDIRLKKCVDYQVISCGEGRHLPTWECLYSGYGCLRSHCIPCYILFPTCMGKPDGLWAHEGKEWSPYYATCRGERAIHGSEICARDESTAMAKLFHPDRRQCLTLWQIPREHGGLEPSCEGKQPGEYTVDETPLMMYRCPGRELFYCQTPFNLHHDMSLCSLFDA